MSTLLSPNMSLPVPSVGTEPGPDYATDINGCMQIIDSHNHAPGQGVQIDPTGLNINTDLSIGENNLIDVRSLRLTDQPAPIGEASDLGCVYNSDGDMYYNDGLGNQVRITQNGSVAGTPGSIANLAAPASASYVSANQKFVWESDTNTAADMDMGAIILRKIVASSASITIQPPIALASDYTITLPATAPASQSFMTMDSSGNIAAPVAISEGITLAMLTQAVQQSLNPAGTILMTGRSTPPTGYLLCDGSSVLRATYPALFTAISTAYGAADGTHFNLPDLRGKFPRGVTGASGADPDAASRTAQSAGGNTGNNVGSIQDDGFESHNHTTTIGYGGSGGGGGDLNKDAVAPTQVYTSSSTGGNETRPINVYVNFIIKT